MKSVRRISYQNKYLLIYPFKVDQLTNDFFTFLPIDKCKKVPKIPRSCAYKDPNLVVVMKKNKEKKFSVSDK